MGIWNRTPRGYAAGVRTNKTQYYRDVGDSYYKRSFYVPHGICNSCNKLHQHNNIITSSYCILLP